MAISTFVDGAATVAQMNLLNRKIYLPRSSKRKWERHEQNTGRLWKVE